MSLEYHSNLHRFKLSYEVSCTPREERLLARIESIKKHYSNLSYVAVQQENEARARKEEEIRHGGFIYSPAGPRAEKERRPGMLAM